MKKIFIIISVSVAMMSCKKESIPTEVKKPNIQVQIVLEYEDGTKSESPILF